MSLGSYVGAGSGVSKLLLHLDGNVTDSSGNSISTTATNVSYVNGVIGTQAASFNGTSSYTNSVITGLATFTLSLWAKKTSGSNFVLIRKDTSGTRHLYGMYNGTGDEIKIGLYNGTFYEVSSTLVPSEGWTHLAMTISGSSGTCVAYKNGKSVGSVGVGAFTAPSSDIYIGRDVLGAAAYYTGYVDEVIYENVVWSPEKMRKYYTYAKGRFANL